MLSSQPEAPGKTAQPLRPIDFVKKVGKGKTLSLPLTFSESQNAFQLLLDGAFTNAQAGAFLQALRIQELSQEELNGLAQVFQSRSGGQRALTGVQTLVLNLASDTQRKGGLVSLLAAKILSEFGIEVGILKSSPVLSKNEKSFNATWKLSEHLPGKEPAVLNSNELISGLMQLDLLRSELGFRSCLHTAEKLINPWPLSPVLLGISHKHYALRMAQTMQALGLTGKIILGNHGTVDLVLHKATEIIAIDQNGIHEETISPKEFGLEISADIYSLNKFSEWEHWLQASHSEKRVQDNDLIKAVQYQGAFFLWSAGVAQNTKDGLAIMANTLPKLFKST